MHFIKSIKKRIRREIAYLSIILSLFLISIIPTRVLNAFLPNLAVRIGFFMKRQNKILKDNLKNTMGKMEEETGVIAKGVWRHIGESIMELEMLRRGKWNLFSFDVDGEEYLLKALNSGKGVIWVSGHIGNWELLPIFFSKKGFKIAVIGREVYDRRLNLKLNEWRESWGIKTLWTQNYSISIGIIRALKKNYILGVLPDQNIRHVKGVYVDFFGLKTFIPSGAFELSLKMKTPLIVGVIQRISDFKHKITIIPIEMVQNPDQIQSNIQFVLKILENFIKQRPEQWVWFHRMWDDPTHNLQS